MMENRSDRQKVAYFARPAEVKAAREGVKYVPDQAGEAAADARATFAMSASASGTMAAARYVSAVFGDQDLPSIDLSIQERIERVHAGEVKEPEAMLMAQATALQAIFTMLAHRAAGLQDRPTVMEQCMRLAFKAQSQCRVTLETLVEIKNPRSVAFVRQANIANGPQQVNNEVLQPRVHEETVESRQNKLLKDGDGKQLDTGATSQAVSPDSKRAPVGAVHRTKKCRG